MIKVKQNLNNLSGIENEDIQKLKNELKKDFKFLFDTKQKLENENKKLKSVLQEAKTEYQELNKEYQEVYKDNEEKNNYIIYYKEYVENLTHQKQELNNRLEEVEHEQYYYTEPVKKRSRYIQRQEEVDEDEDDRGVDYVKNNPLKKQKKIGLSNYIKQ